MTYLSRRAKHVLCVGLRDTLVCPYSLSQKRFLYIFGCLHPEDGIQRHEVRHIEGVDWTTKSSFQINLLMRSTVLDSNSLLGGSSWGRCVPVLPRSSTSGVSFPFALFFPRDSGFIL